MFDDTPPGISSNLSVSIPNKENDMVIFRGDMNNIFLKPTLGRTCTPHFCNRLGYASPGMGIQLCNENAGQLQIQLDPGGSSQEANGFYVVKIARNDSDISDIPHKYT